MPNRFCAICGREINTYSPHFSMCYKCYLKEHPLFEIPDKISIKVCLDCLKYTKKEDWIDPQIKDLDYIIKDAIERFILKIYLKKATIDFNMVLDESSAIYSSKDLLKSINVKITGILKENISIESSQWIQVIIEYELCKNCVNLRGGSYFLSIIQLRIIDEKYLSIIEEALDKIENYVKSIFIKEQRHYISKITNEKNGIDLFLSTNELMNYIISFLRGNYHFILKRSKKLVGRDIQRGKNLYRLKSLIKFLPFGKNDTIIIKNKKYQIDTIIKNKVILKDENHIKYTKDFDYFFNEPIKIIKDK
ncbi:MAG: hypothetical protein JXA99_01025 [Candidatus Lokiarchaeota archaeon]|nr:hypothetical protein [Candidatus Lokiarchaeota archaeon]